MVIPEGVSEGSVRRWAAAVALLLALGACRSERVSLGGEASVVTQVHMVRPAADPAASDPAASDPAASDPAGAATGSAPAVAEPAAATPYERTEPDAVDEAHAFCRKVEQQARETHAGLPKRLDRDTSATRVVAYGCDVVLEYAMHDLRADEVSPGGVRALRAEVVKKLCDDGGARGVMEHGGSFTNVYRDKQSALIEQFTIAAEDCAEPLSADGTAVSFEL